MVQWCVVVIVRRQLGHGQGVVLWPVGLRDGRGGVRMQMVRVVDKGDGVVSGLIVGWQHSPYDCEFCAVERCLVADHSQERIRFETRRLEDEPFAVRLVVASSSIVRMVSAAMTLVAASVMTQRPACRACDTAGCQLSVRLTRLVLLRYSKLGGRGVCPAAVGIYRSAEGSVGLC